MGVEGFVTCFESCVLCSSGVILCCVRDIFPWRFKGDGFQSGLQVFSLGNRYFAEERNHSCVCSFLAR